MIGGFVAVGIAETVAFAAMACRVAGPYESASMNEKLARAKAWLAGRIARAVGEGE